MKFKSKCPTEHKTIIQKVELYLFKYKDYYI